MESPTLTQEKLRGLEESNKTSNSGETNSQNTQDSSKDSSKKRNDKFPKLMAKTSSERKNAQRKRMFERTNSQGYEVVNEDQEEEEIIEMETLSERKFGCIDRKNKFKLEQIDDLPFNSVLSKRQNRARSFDQLESVLEEDFQVIVQEQKSQKSILGHLNLDMNLDKAEFNEAIQKSPLPKINKKYSLNTMTTNLQIEETIYESVEENINQQKVKQRIIKSSKSSTGSHSPMYKLKVDELDLNISTKKNIQNFASNSVNQSPIKEDAEKEEVKEETQYKIDHEEVESMLQKIQVADELSSPQPNQQNKLIPESTKIVEEIEEQVGKEEEKEEESHQHVFVRQRSL